MSRNQNIYNKLSVVALIAGTLSFCFALKAFAFTFEDFRWGRPQQEALDMVKNKGKTILDYKKDRYIKYSDVMLDAECQITLEFTPKTQVLASIRIRWRLKSMGEEVRNLLIEKYGDYYQPNVFIEEYFWYGDDQYDSIVLEYDYAGTTLTYYGGRFQQRYEEELQDLIGNEKQRF